MDVVITNENIKKAKAVIEIEVTEWLRSYIQNHSELHNEEEIAIVFEKNWNYPALAKPDLEKGYVDKRFWDFEDDVILANWHLLASAIDHNTAWVFSTKDGITTFQKNSRYLQED